jgi:hypothetical protein
MRAAAILVLLAAACGGSPTCPKVVPQDGASCEHRGLTCETGGGLHQRCSTIFSCGDALDPTSPTHTAWSVTPPAAGCMQANDPACPADFATAPVAKDCPQEGLACDYDQGRCECVPCNPTGNQWRCRSWSDTTIGSGCPSERPAMGTACDSDGVICRYDDLCRVSLGPDLVCFDGLWQPRIGLPRTCGAPVCGLP